MITFISRTRMLFAVAAVALVIAFALFHDAVYRWAALRALTAAGIDAAIEGEFDVVHRSPMLLNLGALRIALKDHEADGNRGVIGALHLELRLRPLLRGVVQIKNLEVRDVEIELFTLRRSPTEPPPDDAGFTLPLIEQWVLDNVEVGFRLTESGPRNELKVTHLQAAADASGNLRAEGSGSIDGDAWALDGEFGSINEIIRPTGPFPAAVRIDAPDWGLALDARGTVGALHEGRDLRFELRATTDSLAPMLGRLVPEAPVAGALDARALLTGSVDALLLSDLNLSLDDGERFQLALSGTLPLTQQPGGLDIATRLSSADPKVAGYLTRGEVPEIESLRLDFNASSEQGGYRIDQLVAGISGGDALSASVEGGLRLDGPAGGWRPGDIAMHVTAEVPVTRLGPWLPEGVSNAGSAKLLAEVSGDLDRLILGSFQIELSGTAPLRGKVRGDGELALARWRDPQPEAQPVTLGELLPALNVTLDLKTDQVQSLSEALETALPPLGPGTLKATLRRDGDGWRIAGLDARTRTGSKLRTSARGTLTLRTDAGTEVALDAADLTIDVRGQTAAAEEALGFDAPLDPGPFNLSARVRGKSGNLRLAGMTLKAGSEDGLLVALEGKGGGLPSWLAGNFKSLSGVEMKGRVRLPSTRSLGAILGQDVPDLGWLDSSFEARADGAGWAFPSISIGVEGKDELALRANGSVRGVPDKPEFDAEVEVETANASAAAALFGASLTSNAALEAKGRLAGGTERLSYSGGIKLGAADIDARLTLDLAGERPLLSGTLATQALNLDDIGWEGDPKKLGLAPLAPVPRRTGKRLFDDKPLDFGLLAAMDFELELTATASTAGKVDVGDLNLELRNRDRRLHFRFANADVAQGRFSASGEVDASVDPPSVSLESRSENLSMNVLQGWFSDAGERMEGRYSHDMDVSASGRSPHELASTMNGRLRQVVLDGNVAGADLDLLDLHIMQLMLSMLSPRGRTSVGCMLIEFNIKDGIATSDALFVETPRMFVAGAGKIDLRDETMDFLLTARSRRRWNLFNRENTIKVSGPIAALEVEADVGVLSVGTAVTAAVAVSPVLAPVAGFSLLTDLLGGQGETACDQATASKP
jgi:hypothetical protein